MALLDDLLNKGASVVVRYKADVSEAKAGLRELSGAEKKAAQERIASLEAGNKKLEDTAKGWQSVASKVALGAGAIALASKGLEAYAKTGSQAAERVKKLTDGVGGAMDNLLAGVGKVVVAFEPLISAVASVVGLLGDMVGLIGDAVDAILSSPLPADFYKDPGAYYKKIQAARDGIESGDAIRNITALVNQAGDDALGAIFEAQFGEIGPGAIGAAISGAQSAGKGRARGRAAQLTMAQTLARLDAVFSGYGVGDRGASSLGVSNYLAGGGLGVGASQNVDGLGIQRDPIAAAMDRINRQREEMLRARETGYESFRAGKQQSFLESSFGTLEEFNGYASAFNMLTGSVTSALSAWIDGSISAGEAVKKFIGEAVKGLAVQMATESLKHGAYALGSLAFGDVRGAAMHGKAALAFGLGATAAAAAAKQLHAGGGGGPSANVSPTAPQSFSGGGAPAGPERVIVYSDTHAEDTARGRRQRMERAVSRVYGNSATEAW